MHTWTMTRTAVLLAALAVAAATAVIGGNEAAASVPAVRPVISFEMPDRFGLKFRIIFGVTISIPVRVPVVSACAFSRISILAVLLVYTGITQASLLIDR